MSGELRPTVAWTTIAIGVPLLVGLGLAPRTGPPVIVPEAR